MAKKQGTKKIECLVDKIHLDDGRTLWAGQQADVSASEAANWVMSGNAKIVE